MLRFGDIKRSHDFACVYAIVNLNTFRCYVGSTKDLYRRKREHLLMLRKGIHHCSHLQRSFGRHGECRFRIVILEKTSSLIERESFWLSLFGIRNLFNNTVRVDKPQNATPVYGISELGCLKFASIREAGEYIANRLGLSTQGGFSRVQRSCKLHLRVCGMFFSKNNVSINDCIEKRSSLTRARSIERSRLKGVLYQFDTSGTLINRFQSVREAAQSLGVAESSIDSALRIGYASNGFVFSRAETFVAPKSNNKATIVHKGNQRFEFNSMKDACEHFGVPKQSASYAIKYGRTYRGYKWEFAET